MKRTMAVLLALFVSYGSVFAQSGGTLDSTLAEARIYLSALLPARASLLVVSIEAPLKQLSDYAAGALTAQLVNSRNFTIVERSQAVIAQLETEALYQLLGNVSDETAVSVGKQTGAQYIISGDIARAGEQYRLGIKAVNIASGEIAAYKNFLFLPDASFENTLEQSKKRERPQWVDMPLEYGRKTYDRPSANTPSVWYYDVGSSNMAATEQRARTRARENVQQNIAANIANQYAARIDITEQSLFRDTDIEDAERLIQTAVTNSIRTKLPSYETLEWYIDSGKSATGQTWYVAYVLVRFARKDIISVIETIEPEKVTEAIIQQAKIPPAAATTEAKASLVDELIEVRDYALSQITQGGAVN
ncbi:CsgG/HfaB family protein [Treponema primitia]|uniref:CsgG/HfaB family protein n=1 Tax=Treponema primitia TaxID=88058 RepID=UPI003980F24D